MKYIKEDLNLVNLGSECKGVYFKKKAKNWNVLVDKLLTNALIEASCERFKLSEGLDDPYLKFYHSFMVSEAGHYAFYGFTKALSKWFLCKKRWEDFLNLKKI